LLQFFRAQYVGREGYVVKFQPIESCLFFQCFGLVGIVVC